MDVTISPMTDDHIPKRIWNVWKYYGVQGGKLFMCLTIVGGMTVG